MAKLSAYGQKEVARLEKTIEMPGGDLINWKRRTFAFMSNGRVLSKLDVQYVSDGRKECSGWKVTEYKFPKSEDREAAIARLKAKGYAEARLKATWEV